eukprot:scaffold4644_cov99-Isochrysis_galbana.AAC.1
MPDRFSGAAVPKIFKLASYVPKLLSTVSFVMFAPTVATCSVWRLANAFFPSCDSSHCESARLGSWNFAKAALAISWAISTAVSCPSV